MIRRRKLLFIIVFLVFLAIVAVSYVYIRPFFAYTNEKSKLPIEAAEIMPYLNDGDVILRMGDSAWSQMFKEFSLTDKRFSHLGIVKIRDEQITVINSMGYYSIKERGVDEVSLEKFLDSALAAGVFRSKFTDGALISEKAADYVNCPFDWDFDHTEDSKIYCTELLYAVLKTVSPEYNISTRYADTVGKEIIPVDAISTSPYFEEIFYISR